MRVGPIGDGGLPLDGLREPQSVLDGLADWPHTLPVTSDGPALESVARHTDPSAGNSQPWSFVTARRGDALHRRIVPLFAASSRRWAPYAALPVVNVCHRYVEGTDWDSSEFAEYDLGQSVAHMTLQALSMDLASRQFRAFDRDAVHRELGLPSHWIAMTMTAIGRPAGQSPAEGRVRRSLADVWWQPGPGSTD